MSNAADILDLIGQILMVAGLALTLWICLPNLLRFAGCIRFRNGVYGGPAELEPEGKGELYASLYQQLIDLGFEPLGVYWEKVIWHHRSQEFAFVLRKENCQGIIFRLAGGDPRVVLKTVFSNGAIVKTCNYTRPREDSADYFVQGIPTLTLDGLLAEHRRSVAAFTAADHKPRECGTLETYAEAESISFFNDSVQRTYRACERDILIAKVLFLGLLPTILGFICWLNDRTLLSAWFVLFAQSIAYMVYQKRSLRRATQELTEEQEEADSLRQDCARPSLPNKAALPANGVLSSGEGALDNRPKTR